MNNYNPNDINNVTLQMDIPLCLVGWMIGRGGSKLLDIQFRSMCYILMNQNVPDEQPRILSVTGLSSNVSYAYELIQNVLSNAPLYKQQMALQAGGGGSSNNSNNSNSNDTDDIPNSNNNVDGESTSESAESHNPLKAAIVECPAAMLGLLIGKNGWTLKKIIRITGAKITINQSVGVDQPRRVIIYGSDSQVIDASLYINRIVNKGLGLGGDGEGDGGGLEGEMEGGMVCDDSNNTIGSGSEYTANQSQPQPPPPPLPVYPTPKQQNSNSSSKYYRPYHPNPNSHAHASSNTKSNPHTVNSYGNGQGQGQVYYGGEGNHSQVQMQGNGNGNSYGNGYGNGTGYNNTNNTHYNNN